jgi:hypothetical protein
MSFADGMNTVNALLTAPRIDKCIVELILTARERAKLLPQKPGLQPGKAFGIPGCDTEYGPGNMELDTWFLTLYLAEYTAGLLAEKSRDGHCNVHRVAPAFNRCPKMAQEHLEMLGKFKMALTDLVSQIDTIEQKLKVGTAKTGPSNVGPSGP